MKFRDAEEVAVDCLKFGHLGIVMSDINFQAAKNSVMSSLSAAVDTAFVCGLSMALTQGSVSILLRRVPVTSTISAAINQMSDVIGACQCQM